MIKSLTVTNHLGQSLKIDLRNPESSGFLIKSITGLGSNADINTSEIATSDGEVFNSARMNSRDIVLTLYYDEKDPEASRIKSYIYFPSKKKIRLTFDTDHNTYYIDGYVEKNEATVWNKNAYCSITIACPDPYFYSNATNRTVMSGIQAEFEFPFEKEISDSTTMEMSELRVLKERSVVYEGNQDIGIIIKLHMLGEVTGLVIYNTLTREKMSFNDTLLKSLTGSTFLAKDDIEISTINGDKHVKLTREGTETNIINCINRDANWFNISKGDNVFTYTATKGEYNVQMEIQNRIIYEGI